MAQTENNTQVKASELTQLLGRKADDYIKILRERCYGPGNWSNELEGDYGTWDDWKKALIEFYEFVDK